MPQRRPDFRRLGVVVCLLGFLALAPAAAQTPIPDPAQTSTPDSPQTPVPDLAPAPPGPPPQTELNLINLPTTLSIRRHRSYFRLTHRFTRDLGRGDFGDLASDLFSLDSGAIIGLEYRFGLFSNLQLGIHRSILDKAIATFGRWDALAQGDRSPLGVSVTVSYEGGDNLSERHIPSVGVTVSHTFGNYLALYATPAFAGKTRAADRRPDQPGESSDTWFTGLGTRVRVRPSVYVVGEYTPRMGGYDPGQDMWGVAIEKLTGGHTLQLNFTNSFGTTLGQIARGGISDQVFFGFNITRKF
jgi:hypothetical protein